jgi:hypothetical protein
MPTPFRTSVELVNEALANLGVLSPGQPIDVEDFNYVNESLDAIFRKLAALEICYVADPAHIPGPWFSDLAYIVAGECAMKFGSNPDQYQTLIAHGLGGAGNVPVGGGAAAQSLKQITRGRPTYEVLQAEYF